MKIVIATYSFKGTLSIQEACKIIAETIVKHQPNIGLGGQEIENVQEIIPPAYQYSLNIEVLSDVTNPLLGQTGLQRYMVPKKEPRLQLRDS